MNFKKTWHIFLKKEIIKRHVIAVPEVIQVIVQQKSYALETHIKNYTGLVFQLDSVETKQNY